MSILLAKRVENFMMSYVFFSGKVRNLKLWPTKKKKVDYIFATYSLIMKKI